MSRLAARRTAAIMVALGGVPLRTQDPVEVNSRIAKVEFEDDRIRVLRIHYGPHERIGMHQHPAKVVITLTRTHGRMSRPDGTTRESRSEPGIAGWSEAETHAVENLSDEAVETIEIELKHATAPAMPGSAPAADSLRPGAPLPADREPHHRLKYQNQYVRILEVTLGPGESSSLHVHSLDVLHVTLADATVRAQERGEQWGPATAARARSIRFDRASKTPYTHRIENVGGTPFHAIDVEFLP